MGPGGGAPPRSASRAARATPAPFVTPPPGLEAIQREAHVGIVCAGKLGDFSLEDASFAGWLASALERPGAQRDRADTKLAPALAPRDAEEVRAILQGSSHGRYLASLGAEFRADVDRCAEMDVLHRAFGMYGALGTGGGA